ncbi:hypothetical protein M9H77_04437 [Catharanthus roseus]|uniref:Uncharacterized protein n=1 Tax=Catharanthus roseus TaxID=4058 RepID=A0ACC0CE31_CATRO|nr:hypothetical protein M9H77_04437 [Catharanthus roseus]
MSTTLAHTIFPYTLIFIIVSFTLTSSYKLLWPTRLPSYLWRLQTPGAPTRSVLGQHQFRAPPNSPLGGTILLQSMMRYPRRPIGPHPPRSTPLFKWIHSPKSKTSTPSEEALVRGTSHVQCNPLTRPFT